MTMPTVTIGGVTLSPLTSTGRWNFSSLTNEQMKSIMAEVKPVWEAYRALSPKDRPDNAFSDDDDIEDGMIELMDWCESYIDWVPPTYDNNPHYEWMDMMRGLKPYKY